MGGLVNYKDENGRLTQFNLDGLNRVTQATYPATSPIIERFSYDGEGNLLTYIDGRGGTVYLGQPYPL